VVGVNGSIARAKMYPPSGPVLFKPIEAVGATGVLSTGASGVGEVTDAVSIGKGGVGVGVTTGLHPVNPMINRIATNWMRWDM